MSFWQIVGEGDSKRSPGVLRMDASSGELLRQVLWSSELLSSSVRLQLVNEFWESSVSVGNLLASDALSSISEDEMEPATDLCILGRSSLSRFRNLIMVCSALL